MFLLKETEKTSAQLADTTTPLIHIKDDRIASVTVNTDVQTWGPFVQDKELAIDGKPSIAGFHWGDLLNFPEYQIGEEIRLSEYSKGERTDESVYVNYSLLIPPYDPPFEEVENIPAFLRIENNVIIGLDNGPDAEETVAGHSVAGKCLNKRPRSVRPRSEIPFPFCRLGTWETRNSRRHMPRSFLVWR